MPTKSLMKKIVLSIVGVITFLFLFIIFLPSILSLFSKDIDQIDDSDLQLRNITISQADNAYYDLIKVNEIIYEPEGKSDAILDIITGKTWDEKLVGEIISGNAQAFEYFSEATHKPKFQDPAYTDPSKITAYTVLPSVGSWRKMSRLSAIRAMYLAKQGKSKEAFEEAFNSVRIGQKIQDSQAPLIEYLIAMAMKQMGLETIQRILVSSKLSAAELNQYSQELNQFYDNENSLITGFRGEYQIQSWVIDLIASGNEEALKSLTGEEGGIIIDISKKARNNYYFQPNKTKAIFAEYYRTNIKNINKPCNEIKPIDIQLLAPRSPIEVYLTENAVGKILHDISAVGLRGVYKKKCEEDLLIGSTHLLVALKAYKDITGNFPISLDQLAPQYIQTIPIDPFDGKPIKFSLMKKIIYSVGKDSIDSGGSIGDTWKEMPDPTFKIDF